MRRTQIAAVVTLLAAPLVWAQDAHTHARLVLAAESARPGDTVKAAVRLRMDPDWHTYWKNPGTTGLATGIRWKLPPGITAGEIRWPAPEKLVEAEFATYVYNGEVTLLVPLNLAADVPSGHVTIKANVSWLECKVECVPGNTDLEAALVVGQESKQSKEAAQFADWEKKLPQKSDQLKPVAHWDGAGSGDSRRLLVQWSPSGQITGADFFADPSEDFQINPIVERVSSSATDVLLRMSAKRLKTDWPRQISGLLIETSRSGTTGYEASMPVQDGPSLSGTPGTPGSTSAAGPILAPSLWKMLLNAFLGGLILNVMPCVLPVIALKILGFVGQAKDSPGRVRQLGLYYTAGVLVSFLALAGLVIAIQAAGRQAGWGMQFSNPQFVVGLTVLVTLVALNLFGLFEVNLGGGVVGAAGTLASKHGAAGAFFNGVLATILATPCTAPYLSIAVGFAFSQSAGVILLVMLTVGVGLAVPYLALSWHPDWLRYLPKPGPWMEYFKKAMGFPMLATALWLASLTPLYYGARSWWLGIFLVLVALVAWVFGEFVQRGGGRRGLAVIVSLVLLASGYELILEGRLRWRSPVDNESDLISWQAWSPEAVVAARAEGRPILVDFTAAWCLTCNAIVKPALESDAIAQRVKQDMVVPLLGDYTLYPTNILNELKHFARGGVPLVLVYPKNPSEQPFVLREPVPFELPAHYRSMVLSFLDKASK